MAVISARCRECGGSFLDYATDDSAELCPDCEEYEECHSASVVLAVAAAVERLIQIAEMPTLLMPDRLARQPAIDAGRAALELARSLQGSEENNACANKLRALEQAVMQANVKYELQSEHVEFLRSNLRAAETELAERIEFRRLCVVQLEAWEQTNQGNG